MRLDSVKLDSVVSQFARRLPWCSAWRRRGQEMMDALLHPYRPERHYMRGPGPKWHAKYGPQR